ncbi:15059_t:CDS:2 [Acaulospora colombiana]|uniref:15059_t:CDS:1 n=1 Tax=Acaulospora colombiana TaxID=27376 RepID=A0ACA9MXM9_9GLOM|nr:15059_t:CDS:2 [Acaulospora colombiana]
MYFVSRRTISEQLRLLGISNHWLSHYWLATRLKGALQKESSIPRVDHPLRHDLRTYTRESASAPGFPLIDIHDKSYPAHVWLYIFCGLLDSMWQTTAKLAYLAGLYKSIQSAGGAVSWRIDGIKLRKFSLYRVSLVNDGHKAYMNIFISTWVLLVAGLIFALPMLYLRVKEHTDLQDETLARMDDSGRVLGVHEAEEKLAEAGVRA